MRLPYPRVSKQTLFIALASLIVAIAIVGLFASRTSGNPLPPKIKSQVSYKVIYPAKTSQITPTSYDYQADQKTLTFSIMDSGNSIVFTEQPAPESLGSGSQVYYPALGLHPYAQFQTKLGPVALVKFWDSGTLAPAGESGVLASGGTLLIAHSSKLLTNAQWKDLFETLKLTK